MERKSGILQDQDDPGCRLQQAQENRKVEPEPAAPQNTGGVFSRTEGHSNGRQRRKEKGNNTEVKRNGIVESAAIFQVSEFPFSPPALQTDRTDMFPFQFDIAK